MCAILIKIQQVSTDEPHGLYPHIESLTDVFITHASTEYLNSAYSCRYLQNQEKTYTLIEIQ